MKDLFEAMQFIAGCMIYISVSGFAAFLIYKKVDGWGWFLIFAAMLLLNLRIKVGA